MPGMHSKKPWFTYSTCEPFTKNKERIQKISRNRDSGYLYKNELDKAYFQHDTAYGDIKDSTRKIASDKFLRDLIFNFKCC